MLTCQIDTTLEYVCDHLNKNPTWIVLDSKKRIKIDLYKD